MSKGNWNNGIVKHISVPPADTWVCLLPEAVLVHPVGSLHHQEHQEPASLEPFGQHGGLDLPWRHAHQAGVGEAGALWSLKVGGGGRCLGLPRWREDGVVDVVWSVDGEGVVQHPVSWRKQMNYDR